MSNNPSASLESETFSPDQLIHSNSHDLIDEKVTLLSGENRTRGALLGKVTIGAVSQAAAAGNTGNGTLTGQAVGSATAPKRGVYRVICIEPAANAGVFAVEDPDGIVIGKATVGVAFDNQIAFTLNDGAA